MKKTIEELEAELNAARKAVEAGEDAPTAGEPPVGEKKQSRTIEDLEAHLADLEREAKKEAEDFKLWSDGLQKKYNDRLTEYQKWMQAQAAKTTEVKGAIKYLKGEL